MARGFGRIQSSYDNRDYNLLSFIPYGEMRKMNFEKAWDFPTESLDQGDTPHCVGFSMAAFGINLPVFTPYTNEAGHKFYYQCKDLDGKPKSEEGSTIRTASKLLKQEGIIEAYAFATNIAVMKWWVLNRGPLIVGTIWTEEMITPGPDNILKTGGAVAGGHAYLINEWRKDNYIGIQNSWGSTWGCNGKAYIHVMDFEKLFAYDGEAMTAVELENRRINRPCKLLDIIKNLFKKL